MTKQYVGIDYSLSSPATVVITSGEDSDDIKCLCYGKKKLQGRYRKDNFILDIIEYPSYSNDQERYIKLASDSLKFISQYTEKEYLVGVRLEGYSYNSVGQVFNLAENMSILKYYLYLNEYKFDTLAPTSVKKFASNKGNANKNLMYDSFDQLQIVNLKELLSMNSENVGNPISDIVDAYYLAKSLKEGIPSN